MADASLLLMHSHLACALASLAVVEYLAAFEQEQEGDEKSAVDVACNSDSKVLHSDSVQNEVVVVAVEELKLGLKAFRQHSK